MEQLKLFDDPPSELDAVWQRIEELKETHRKTRKRLFGEVSDLQKTMIKLSADNERLKFHAGISTNALKGLE